MGKKLTVAKDVVKVAVGIGVSTIVSSTIKQVTSDEKGVGKRLCIWAAGIALVGMVGQKVGNYVDGIFNDISKKVDEPGENMEQEDV